MALVFTFTFTAAPYMALQQNTTPVAASDTSADKPEQAAYFEWSEEGGTVHRFSALQTETACYLAFSWELLTGEELDDPALLFRIDEGEQTDGIFCFR